MIIKNNQNCICMCISYDSNYTRKTHGLLQVSQQMVKTCNKLDGIIRPVTSLFHKSDTVVI